VKFSIYDVRGYLIKIFGYEKKKVDILLNPFLTSYFLSEPVHFSPLDEFEKFENYLLIGVKRPSYFSSISNLMNAYVQEIYPLSG
jgi:hypothetical protein